MRDYTQGTLLRLTGTFKNLGGALADPTAITLKVQKPDGTSTSYTYAGAQVVKQSTGVYYYDVDLNQAGTWYYRYEGTSACQAAGQDSFSVTAALPA